MADTINEQDEKTLFKEYVDRFPEAGVLVVGDIIVDEYVWGDVSRISPEAPVPVVDVRRETRMCGGAANVIYNLASMGASPVLCGVVGEDADGNYLLNKIRELGLTTKGIICEKGRPTSIKTRIVAHNQQVVRFDRESRNRIAPETTEGILSVIRDRLDHIDAIIVSDYGKGVISTPLMRGLRELMKEASDLPVIITVDPKTGNFEHYKGVDAITPNHHEAGKYCGFEIVDHESLVRAGNQMLEELECRSVLITQGSEGMTLFERGMDPVHIPTMAKKVFDVTGAGDTVIGTLSLGLASGLDLKSSAILANLAAGIVVGEVGTSVVRADQLKTAVNGTRVP